MVLLDGFVIVHLRYSTRRNADRVFENASLHLLPGCLPALLLFLLLLPLLLLSMMSSIEASGGSAEHAVMAGIVSGGAANHGAFDTTLGVGGIGGQRQRGDGKKGGNRFHGDKIL